MTTLPIRVEPIDVRRANEAAYAALNTFENQMRAERWPDDPPESLEEQIKNLQSIPPFIEVHNWVVWSDGEIIASCGCGLTREETNQHLLFGGIDALPAYRGRGLARRLLAHMVAVAQCEGRRLLIGETYSTIPAGEAFMQRLGAKLGLAQHVNQLEFAELDRDLIQHWIAGAQERARDFELGLWEGAYPEADLQAICDLYNVMNTAPRDDLEMEDWIMTPEKARQFEDSMRLRGSERWTLYVRHKPTGELAGYTETVWNRYRPDLLEQYGTGVWPEFRNHGLGRWLKAAMIDKTLRERPQVQRIRTSNAYSNAPMLKINRELGFKPYVSQYSWQVEADKVLTYLQTRQALSAEGAMQ